MEDDCPEKKARPGGESSRARIRGDFFGKRVNGLKPKRSPSASCFRDHWLEGYLCYLTADRPHSRARLHLLNAIKLYKTYRQTGIGVFRKWAWRSFQRCAQAL
jgi:hypothetical protein